MTQTELYNLLVKSGMNPKSARLNALHNVEVVNES